MGNSNICECWSTEMKVKTKTGKLRIVVADVDYNIIGSHPNHNKCADILELVQKSIHANGKNSDKEILQSMFVPYIQCLVGDIDTKIKK